MNDAAIQTLQTSSDAKELLKAAATLASSDRLDDHQTLLKTLSSSDLLSNLNSPEQYAGDRKRLKVRRILDVLVKNKSPFATQTLLGLTRNPVFLQEISRIELLILATAEIRPMPPELVAFWDRYSQPEDATTSVVITAIFINGSEAALNLFEAKMRNLAHDADEKVYWMRYDVLPHRDSPVVVASCGRLLKSGLDERLRSEMVDVLFDYKPAIWYTPAVNFNPPAIASYPPDTRSQLLNLANYVLTNMQLSDAQKNAIENTKLKLE